MRETTYADNEYWRNQFLSASRERLLVMTYDGALRFLRSAASAMEQRDLEAQHLNITKAQAIVLELLCSLDHSVNSQLAGNLDRLYRYVYDRLTEANVHDRMEALREAERLLSELREAWAEAELRSYQGESRAAAPRAR
jgi:flagellar protein FliS